MLNSNKLKLLSHNACSPREYDSGYIVCVCNASYCDDILPSSFTAKNQVFMYTSSRSGKRMERKELAWTKNSKLAMVNHASAYMIKIDPHIRRQTMYGFGGAFTDSTGFNIASLSSATQKHLMESYFGPGGIEYNLGRVPMASCDFSWRVYSYDDTANDFSLDFFSLTEEDFLYKVPYINWARKLARLPLRLIASPWSAPAWMKTNGKMNGNGTMIGNPGSKYYNTWADYFVRFLTEYKKLNITFWAVTAQNEPSTGFIYNYSFQTMGFTAEMQRDFVKYDLGPALNLGGYQDVHLMVLDDQRLLLPKWAKTVLLDVAARKFVSFIAVHWYADMITPVGVLEATHDLFPNVPIIGSEASQGFAFWERRGPVLGSWHRAEKYAHFIISDLNHWVSGWVEWNLILDWQGGPNWAKNYLDSPVIKTGTDEFVKQPMFYAIGHFSKFITPGAVNIHLKIMPSDLALEGTSFIRTDVIVTNPVTDAALNVTLPWMSINTLLWRS
ncbi:unnamed protein product [Soboliphyme baturini]|uniref:Glucosylceramidase n=1 Tax=Soboliphyme baturini TaxID=241478 RepID=A0A3P8A3F8_9BILA|nr:unnamed protein product [Soboliphyme baturini]